MFQFISQTKSHVSFQSGFTLIEVLISAGIIIMVSLLVISNLSGSTQRNTLNNEAERLSSLIRQAHINSLIGTTVGGLRPLGGFGIHLTQCASGCTYILFADDGSYVYENGIDTDVQNLDTLSDNVQINLLEPAAPLDIVFVPPYGDIYINGAALSDSATTTLTFANTSYIKKVILNRLTGRLDIQ